MNLKPLASLVLLAFFIATMPVWGKTIPDDLGGAVTDSKLTRDTTLVDCGALTVGALDLNGYKLTLTGVTGMSGTGMINGAVGSVLDVELTANVTQTATLTGSLKLTKRGSGIWTTKASSTSYSGGTEIVAGGYQGPSSGNSAPYGNPVNILVHLGATLYTHAYYGFATSDTITLNGGTLANGGNNNNSYPDRVVSPTIECSADSSFYIDKSMPIGAAFHLGGHTLTIASPSDNPLWKPSEISNGEIVLLSGKLILTQDVGSSTASLTLASGTELVGAYAYSVSNLTFNTMADKVEGGINVYGAYKPSAPGAYYPKMMDGSTLDLSGLSAAATPTAANFDSGTVTIALGDRALASGQQIVSWTAAPEDVTFTFTGNNIGDKTFVVSGNGIVYDASAGVIETAVWTGAAEDGDYLNPRNWTFLNATGDAVPVTEITKKMCENLTVALSGDVSALTMDATFPFAKVRFSEAFLSSDTDWSSFDICKMADGSVLDVKGRRLTLPSLVGDFAAAVMITNSAAKVSLDLTVAAGNVFTNSALSIMGNFDVVKRGGGTFVAEKYPQEYAGVTIVSNGVLRCKQDANLNATAGKSPFGSRGTIDIAPNGVLDPAGSYAWSNFTINMRGGIISNTVEQTGFTGAYNTQNFAYPFDPLLCLYADTLLTSTESYNFKGRVASNGHKMRLRMCEYRQTLTWAPIVIGPAEVVCLLGKLKTLSNFAPDTPELTLVMDGATFDYGCDLAISNYVAKTSEYSPVQMADDARGKGEFLMNISGAFTPMALQFYGCTMRNGSTIFLAGKEGAWSTTTVSKSQNGKQYGRQTVDFEDDATVTIDIGARELKKGDKLVSWAAAPANLSMLKFVLRGSALASNARLDVREDGIYIVRKGLVLTIR